MNYLKLLVLFTALIGTFPTHAQRVKKDDGSVSFTIFKSVELHRDHFIEKSLKTYGQEKSALLMQPWRAPVGDVTVQVFANHSYSTPNNPGVLLLKFSWARQDFTNLNNLSGVGYPNGDVSEKPDKDFSELWEDVAKKGGNVLLDAVYEDQSAKAKGDKPLGKKVNHALPVRIVLTFSKAVDTLVFDKIKVPYVPALRDLNGEKSTLSDRDQEHLEGTTPNFRLASWFGFEYFTETPKIKFIGLKRMEISELEFQAKILNSLIPNTEFEKYYRRSLPIFGTSNIKITRKVLPYSRKDWQAYIDKMKTKDSWGNSDVSKICNQFTGLIDSDYFKKHNTITPSDINHLKSKLLASSDYTEAAKDSPIFLELWLEYLSRTQVSLPLAWGALNKGEVLLPLNKSAFNVIQTNPQFKIYDANSSYILATSVEVIKHNIRVLYENGNIQMIIFQPGRNSAVNIKGKKKYTPSPIFKGEAGNGSTYEYSLYRIGFIKNGQPIKGNFTIIGTVTDEGPFPVDYNFDPRPIRNETSAPLFDGPTSQKPHLIGSHRGESWSPGIPENSPWAWERAIYEAKKGGHELDIIEIDANVYSADHELVILHGNNPLRVIDIGASTPKETPLYSYYPPSKNSQGIYLSERKMLDHFANPVPGTYPLTLKTGLNYFKCRQTKTACECLQEVGYLPKLAPSCTKIFFEQTADYADKEWVLENNQPIHIMIALDKLIGQNLNKSTTYFLQGYEAVLEAGMEDYVSFIGQISPEQLESGIGEIDEYRKSVLNQVFYFPVFYHDRKESEKNEAFMNTFIRNSQRLDYHNRWNIIGCQPQVMTPTTGGNMDILRKTVEIAYNNNLWVEIFGGSPMRPNENYSMTWRSIPEFDWTERCNVWMTDSPGLIDNFLKAMKRGGETKTSPFNPSLYTGLTKSDTKSDYVNSTSALSSRTVSFDFSSINRSFFILPGPTKNISGYNSNLKITTTSNVRPTVSSEQGINYLKMDPTGGSHYVLKQNKLFGLDNTTSHFTFSLWVYYDGQKPTFEIFNALPSSLQPKSSDALFSVSSVDGKIVWTRNTSFVDPTSIEQYDYTPKQGCAFDQGDGWYFLVVSMAPNACKIGLGKPKNADYIGLNYGIWEKPKASLPIGSPGKNKDMAVAFTVMGSTMQGYNTVETSFIGDPNGVNNPIAISDFRVSNSAISLETMYALFREKKDSYRKLGSLSTPPHQRVQPKN